MIYPFQILLLGILVTLLLVRFDIVRLKKEEKRKQEWIKRFLTAVDSYLIKKDMHELSGLSYRSRLLLDIAENPSESIASIRILLGSVIAISSEQNDIIPVRACAEVAITAINYHNRFKSKVAGKWRFFFKFPDRIDEKSILTVRENILARFSKICAIAE